MSTQHVLVHVEDVEPENMKKGDGWAISEFRLPISGAHGSSTTLFHSIFRPGSTHARHRHRDCDEIAVYLKGHGLVGQSNERTAVRPGHCRLMPRGSAHFFHNETRDEEGLVIGFYVGAGSVTETGYEFCGAVSAADLEAPRANTLSEGILVGVEAVEPLELDERDGWSVRDFRMPIGSHNGSRAALYWARFEAGEARHRHRLDKCEELYYVVSGRGIVGVGEDRREIRAGHVHYIARGVERFMANAPGSKEPLEVIGVLTGAGSLGEAGHVHTGRARF